MNSSTVRIQKKDRHVLKQIAARKKESMQEVLHEAIEEYRRKIFLESVNAAYSLLKENETAWKEEEKERKLWDATLNDGLDDL